MCVACCVFSSKFGEHDPLLENGALPLVENGDSDGLPPPALLCEKALTSCVLYVSVGRSSVRHVVSVRRLAAVMRPIRNSREILARQNFLSALRD